MNCKNKSLCVNKLNLKQFSIFLYNSNNQAANQYKIENIKHLKIYKLFPVMRHVDTVFRVANAQLLYLLDKGFSIIITVLLMFRPIFLLTLYTAILPLEHLDTFRAVEKLPGVLQVEASKITAAVSPLPLNLQLRHQVGLQSVGVLNPGSHLLIRLLVLHEVLPHLNIVSLKNSWIYEVVGILQVGVRTKECFLVHLLASNIQESSGDATIVPDDAPVETGVDAQHPGVDVSRVD